MEIRKGEKSKLILLKLSLGNILELVASLPGAFKLRMEIAVPDHFLQYALLRQRR